MSDEPYNVCDCGHRESWHDTPHSPTCTGQFGRCECDTYHFDHVWPPPARSRAETEKAITAVLGEHQAWASQCSCGYAIKTKGNGQIVGGVAPNADTYYLSLRPEEHRAHVASVLADLVADGPTLADAPEGDR